MELWGISIALVDGLDAETSVGTDMTKFGYHVCTGWGFERITKVWNCDKQIVLYFTPFPNANQEAEMQGQGKQEPHFRSISADQLVSQLFCIEPGHWFITWISGLVQNKVVD